jgi:hypothetical protein
MLIVPSIPHLLDRSTQIRHSFLAILQVKRFAFLTLIHCEVEKDERSIPNHRNMRVVLAEMGRSASKIQETAGEKEEERRYWKWESQKCWRCESFDLKNWVGNFEERIKEMKNWSKFDQKHLKCGQLFQGYQMPIKNSDLTRGNSQGRERDPQFSLTPSWASFSLPQLVSKMCILEEKRQDVTGAFCEHSQRFWTAYRSTIMNFCQIRFFWNYPAIARVSNRIQSSDSLSFSIFTFWELSSAFEWNVIKIAWD